MKYKQTIIVSDFHIPYEDTEKVELFFEHLERLKPDRIIIAGDLVDCSELSRFRKNPITQESFQNEISFANEYLARIRKICPNARIDYVEGNHEFRFKVRLMEEVPSLYFAMGKELPDLLGLKKLKINWHPLREGLTKFSHNYIKVGNYLVGHFDKSLKNKGYTARMLRDEFGMSIIQAHSHGIGSSCRTYHSGVKCGYEIGCLCDRNRTFTNASDWQHGFGVIESGKFYQVILDDL